MKKNLKYDVKGTEAVVRMCSRESCSEMLPSITRYTPLMIQNYKRTSSLDFFMKIRKLFQDSSKRRRLLIKYQNITFEELFRKIDFEHINIVGKESINNS